MAAATSPTMSSSSPSWQESISDLVSVISSNDDDVKTAGIIEKACIAIIERDDNAGDADLPEAVRATIATIYLRSLIKLGKYNAVVEYCEKRSKLQSTHQSEIEPNADGCTYNNAEEWAYSLYRLKNYDACRKLCFEASSTGHNSSRGLMHIRAQAHYRMGETIYADLVYRQLLLTDEDDSNSEETKDVDADEREDALSNALATCIANYTPGSNLPWLFSKKTPWLENVDTLKQLLSTYGAKSPTTTPSASTDAEDLLQNYDLAYNLGTYLLISSEMRSQSQLLEAKNLLEHAEASALTILDSSSASPSTEAEETDAIEKARQQQQQQLAEREANPIRANLALSKMLLGGTTNEMDALRTYLTLVTKAMSNKSKGGKKSAAAAAVEGNLLAIASNNLAALRDGKESLFDVLKRIPMTSSHSVSEDGQGDNIAKKGGKEKASATMVPLVGATPQQVRTALYNRALLYAKMGNVTSCLEALDVLRASMLVSYHGDESEKIKLINEEGSSSPKRAKGKKKKGSVVASTASSGEIEEKDVPTAKPASNVETVAWNALTKLLESEVYRKSESKDVSPNDILDDAIERLELMEEYHSQREDAGGVSSSECARVGVLPYTMSKLMLHKAIMNNPPQQSKEATQPLIEALESLPEIIKSCPGVTMSLASLYASSPENQVKNETVERTLSSLGNDSYAKLATAKFHIARSEYAAAATVLQEIADEEVGNDSDDTSLVMEAMALLAKALSYTDPQKAEEYSVYLQDAIEFRAKGDMEGGSELNGELLETMDIPRFAKKASDRSAGGVNDQGDGSSSKVRKMIADIGGKGRSNLG